MGNEEAKIRDVSNALRAAMRAGDTQLSGSRLDQKFLQAIVAGAAADAASWVRSRVDDGDRVSAPLTDLTESLRPGDFVGNSLRSIESAAIKEGKGLASALIFKSAIPVATAAIVTWILARLNFVYDIASAIGGSIGPSIGSVVGPVLAFALGPGMIFIFMRGLGVALSPAFEKTEKVGWRAEKIFEDNARSALVNVDPGLSDHLAGVKVLRRLRLYLQAILIILVLMTVIASLIFATGVKDAVESGNLRARVCDTPTSGSLFCPKR